MIARLYKERQKSTQEALEELKEITAEINAARKEQAEKRMSVEAFSISWLLKNEGINDHEQKAIQMEDVLKKFPHWKRSERHEREFKQRLCAVLLQSGIRDIPKVTRIMQSIMRVIKGDKGSVG